MEFPEFLVHLWVLLGLRVGPRSGSSVDLKYDLVQCKHSESIVKVKKSTSVGKSWQCQCTQ